jgi:hypothetical protein
MKIFILLALGFILTGKLLTSYDIIKRTYSSETFRLYLKLIYVLKNQLIKGIRLYDFN